ncbi:hypothetical protein FNV43_RR17177 [Rhamnella rubrinervis]|uniref:Protein kinase domain-containing protein n=1 Tax=Rhamnella rubrinervis TaxID=2594499 RepID=A0A8K0DWL8_9ROSA|nr:hypothetical protein FNV43_RR17177 [Rhamnella rubrinervis]
MLVGAYPFEDPDEPKDYRKTIQISQECHNLISRIFVADPAMIIAEATIPTVDTHGLNQFMTDNLDMDDDMESLDSDPSWMLIAVVKLSMPFDCKLWLLAFKMSILLFNVV